MDNSSTILSNVTTGQSNITTADPTVLLQQLNDKLAIRYLPVIIYMFILMVVGTIGNAFVLHIYRKKQRKTSTDFFIISLAIFDLLTCIIGMPTEIADLRYPYMFYSAVACKLFRAIESISNTGSTITLVAIAVDRYRRICNMGKTIQPKTAKIICVAAFIIGVVTQSWPVALIFGNKRVDVGIPGANAVDCSTDDSVKGTIYPLLYYGFLFIYFFVCVIFFCVVYGRISLFVWRQRKFSRKAFQEEKLKGDNNETLSSELSSGVSSKHNIVAARKNTEHNGRAVSRFSRKINLTKTTLTVVAITVAFVMSFLPFLSVMVIRNIKKDFEESLNPSAEVFYKFCLKSFFVNNAINPIIYSFLNIQFRNSVKSLLKSMFGFTCNCTCRCIFCCRRHKRKSADIHKTVSG